MRASIRIRVLLWAASAVVYLVLFALFVDHLGTAISPLTALPVLLGGWLFGMRAGLGIGLLVIPVNLALLALAGVERTQHGVEIPGYVAVLVVAAGADRIRDLGHELGRRAAEDVQGTAMRRVLASAPVFIVVTSGPEHRIAYLNDEARRVFSDASLGRPVSELARADDPSIRPALDRAYTSGEPFERRDVPVRLLATGAVTFVDLRIEPARDTAGGTEGLLLYATDVSASMAARTAIAARARQQAALATMGQRALGGEPIPALAAAACEVAQRLLGVDVVELDEPVGGLGEIRALARAGSDGHGEECVALCRHVLFSQRTSVLQRAAGGTWNTVAHEDGGARGYGVAVAVRGVGRVLGVLSAFSRGSRRFSADEVFFLSSLAGVIARAMDRKATEAEIQHQALYDPLTGLPNRRLLLDRLQQAIRRARRDRTEAALVVLDIDRLKLVNDAHGHDVGDRLLGQVAQRLREITRDADTVARLEADEFAIVASAPLDHADIDEVAARVLAALREPFALGAELRITASLGAAVTPADGADAEALVHRAEMAMHAAKGQGAGWLRYRPELDENAREDLALASDLRAALEQHALEVVFQPKVDLASGRVVGVEALARWRHPTLGPIPPERFVPAAEQNGLIDELTSRVLDLAADECARWRARGLALGLAVNVSMRSLRDGTLGEHVDAIIAAHSFPRDLLTLEITESATTDGLVDVAGRLASLHEHGVHLSIDDYGTAYSSLQHVRQLPVQEVKIDRSFVADLLTNASSAAIVRSTIDLAHALGLTVVAEGVETREVWDRLRELGCDVAQGYLISQPLTAAEFDVWIAARSSAPVA